MDKFSNDDKSNLSTCDITDADSPSESLQIGTDQVSDKISDKISDKFIEEKKAEPKVEADIIATKSEEKEEKIEEKIIELERQLQSARLAVADANREKSYFLANMSHEIRTPLGAIMGFAEALRDPTLSEDEKSKFIQILIRNGKNLNHLVDDILDLSKVESGSLEFDSSEIKIPEMVEGIVENLKSKAEAKGLEISTTIKGQIPSSVFTDEIRLRQILWNVLENAIKFTAVGHIDLQMAFRSKMSSRGLFEFYISDTGLGISAEDQRRIFEPFTQVDSSANRKQGGTGLGLALSQLLAKAMGGEIRLLESEPGIGSTFLIEVEVELPEIATPHQQKTVFDINGTARVNEGLRILIAEDSPDNQLLICRLLGNIGANMELAENGEEAVHKAMESKYDMVLMDMQMPKVDGYEATRQLRQAGFSQPIIALTANAMRHDRQKCLNAGCTEYLSKPIDAQKLFRMMGQILPPA